MSTHEDLMLDAQREAMLDRCDALHVDEPEEGCPGCEEREQMRLEDDEHDASLIVSGGVVIARVSRVDA